MVMEIHAPGNSPKNDWIRSKMESEHPSLDVDLSVPYGVIYQSHPGSAGEEFLCIFTMENSLQ